MKTKTILIAAGVTVAAAILWRVWRRQKKAAGAGIASTTGNVRDTVTQKSASRKNLGIDLDPSGL